MRKNVLNSPHLLELKKKRRRIVLSKILLSIFLFVVIFGSLAYISHTPFLNISGIEITGSKAIDTEKVKEIVQRNISGNYLWFFPKTNIFFYPKNKIKNELSETFKRLKDVAFTISSDKTLQVSLLEKDPKYIWCGETIDLTKEEKCSFVDETGFIFDDAPFFSKEVFFKFYGVLPTDFAKFVLFKQTIEGIGLKPVALYTKNNGNMKVFLSAKSSASMGPEIIFNSDYDFEKITENLQTALTTEPLQSDFKNKYDSLLYIDLRPANKVYYKFI
ncbi:MAG: hypothetical protein WCG28_03010 [bacterium]